MAISTINSNSKVDFLASLDQISSQADPVQFALMLEAYKSIPERNLTLPENCKVIDFAVDQMGKWQVRWYWSSVKSPDVAAQKESIDWGHFWKASVNALEKADGKLGGILTEQKSKVLLLHQIQRKVENDRDKPFSQITSHIMGRLSFGLSKLGFRSLAREVYKKSIWPPGTVARSSLADETPNRRSEDRYPVELTREQITMVMGVVDKEIEKLEEREWAIINEAAKRGDTISREKALESVENMKATYQGPNREEYVKEIDRILALFRQMHPPEIPVDVAWRFVKEIEKKFGPL